jgi:ligand-binding sensor domain-containing protein
MGKIKSLLLFIWIFTCIINIKAQNSEWLDYTDGSDIRAIASEGNFIWVATSGGLVRINSINNETKFYNKANSGLPNNNITSVAIDKFGNKWIGTEGYGLVKFDGNNWIVYNTANSSLPITNIL